MHTVEAEEAWCLLLNLEFKNAGIIFGEKTLNTMN